MYCYLCHRKGKSSPLFKNGCCKECFDDLPNILYPTGFKKCYYCEKEKSLNDYYFDKRVNLPRYLCKICYNIKSKENQQKRKQEKEINQINPLKNDNC